MVLRGCQIAMRERDAGEKGRLLLALHRSDGACDCQDSGYCRVQADQDVESGEKVSRRSRREGTFEVKARAVGMI